MSSYNRWRANVTACVRFTVTAICLVVISGSGTAQILANASFEAPTVTANTDSLRPSTATWSFSGQAGIRNNNAPNGSDGKQTAFLSVAPVGGNNNLGSIRQTVTLKPGVHYVRYLTAVKTPGGRPQPLQFYVDNVPRGGALRPRYLTDATTGGFEAVWTQPFVVSTEGSYELRFDATNVTNYGTAAAPLYAVAYVDAVTIVSVPAGFANSGFEATGNWTLSSGATAAAATDAPEGTKVLNMASAATARQSLVLPVGRYSVSLKLGKASAAAGTLKVEIASNGAAAITVASISATTAAEYRSYSTAGVALASGTHVVTLRASGSSFSIDNVVLNDAGPDILNSGFETPVLAAPSSATAAGPTIANPTNASWTFSGSGGAIQANAGSSNTSAPRTIAGKQYLALSGTGAVAQTLTFAGGTYVAVGQVAQGALKVMIDGAPVGRVSAATLDFREVMSAPFVVAAGSHSLGLSVDTTYTPATPKLDEIRLVRIDVPPAVSITAPVNGAVYQTGATVDITASASDPDGVGNLSISRTPAGGSTTLLASSGTSPLSTNWTNSSANRYTITASATDSTGATNSTEVAIRVNANPNATVSVSPAGPVITSATAVTATVTAGAVSDADGTVTKIEFLKDAVVATTCTKTIPPAVAPFTCALSLPPRAASYALVVRVTDNDGGVTTTPALTLRINTAPTVTLVATCVAPCFAPATVNLTATPSDTDGTIGKVEFYDGTSLLGTKTAPPWTHSHANASAATHSYTAKAFDNDNANKTSAVQSVTVTAPAPSLALSASCVASCNAPAAVTLTAAPANITGTVSKVEFYDGAVLLNSDTSAPYSFTPSSVAAATHSYTAKVYVTGTTAAVATSSAQVVRVNALPTVTLAASCVAPCSNPATVNLTAVPADADGTISKVEFYEGATLVATNTVAPWSYVHTNLPVGNYSYTARATDNSAGMKLSATQAITVTPPANAPPIVTWIAPYGGAPNNALGTYNFAVTASDSDGSVADVRFFANGALLGTGILVNGNYVYEWTNLPAGDFQVTAVATDNLGATTESWPTLVRVGDTVALSLQTPATVFAYGAPPEVNLPYSIAPLLFTRPPISDPEHLADGNYGYRVTLLENGVTVGEQWMHYERSDVPPGDGSSYWYYDNPTRYVIERKGTPFVRSGLPLGTYQYTLQVVPGIGTVWRSPPTTVTIADARPTLAVISEAADGLIYQGGVILKGMAPAFAANGWIGFSEGGTSVGGCQSVAWTCTLNWRDATPGTHTVVAKATDLLGAVWSSDPITFTVVANTSPVVEFSSPVDYAGFKSPATVTVKAAAADADGSIASVEFFSDYRTSLGLGIYDGSTYNLTLPEVAATNYNKSLTVRARATDNRGAVSGDAFVQYTVYAAPVVNVQTQCEWIACYAGAVTIGYSSNHAENAIATLRYLRDGQVFATVSPPANDVVDIGSGGGAHEYRVEMTTIFGDTVLSAPFIVSVTPNASPVVSLVNPVDAAMLANITSLQLRANASDGDGTISRVEFYLNGTTLLGTGAPSAGQFVYNWAVPAPGNYILTARAYDNRNAYTNSAVANIVVVGGPGAADILTPTNGMEFPGGQVVNVTAGGSEADPTITHIELWRVGSGGADLLLTEAPGKVLSYDFTVPSVSSSISLYTIAVNALGGRTKSPIVTFSVRTDITDPRYFVWTNMNAALKAGNKAAALEFLTPTAQENYGAAFDLILPIASAIVASYSPILQISDSFDLADYLVARTESGTRLVFALRFILMDDGKWKLDGL